MPFYIYLTAPFIALFGLNEFSVRFPSAFFGSLTVLVVYFLVKELFSRLNSLTPGLRNSPANRRGKGNPGVFSLAGLASFLLAISPWHLFYSRMAFEANLCLFLITAGWLFFLRARQKPAFLIAAGFLFGLSFYTYNSVFIFLPPLLLITLLIYRQELFTKKNFGGLLVAGLIFLFLFGHAAFSSWQVSQAKKAITIFSDPGIIDRFNHQRTFLFSQKPLLAKLWLNKPFYFLRIIFKNYLLTFSPKFLFFSGSSHPWHSSPGFGNFYRIELVFVLLGIISFFSLKGKSKWFLASWLLLSPLASAITVDAPHSTRSLPLIIPLLVIVSLGIYRLAILLKNKQSKIFFSVLCSLFYVLSFGHWLYSFYYLFPRRQPPALMFGLKEALLFAQEKRTGEEIVMHNPPDSPYIYTLFHLKIDPENFLKTVKRYGPGIDNLEHVRSFGQFKFLYPSAEEEKRGFYILRRQGESSDKLEKIIVDPDGKPLFSVYYF